MDGALRPFPGSTRYLYYATRFTGQAAQNILLAGLFLAAGTSGSAAIDLSSVFVAILVPAVALGPLGGALADRLGPARAYPLGAFLRFLVAGFALYALTGLGWVWAVAFLYSAASQLFTPAEMALVNSLRRGGSGGIHSSLQAQQYVAQGLGMVALAPALYFLGGLPAILLGAFAGKALLVVLALGVAKAMNGSTAIQGQRSREAFGFRPVARFFLSEHAATYAVALQAFKTIVSRAVMVALPIYLAHDMGVQQNMVVFLLVPGALGVAAGLLWSRTFSAASAPAAMRLSMLGLVVSVFALAALDYGLSAFARYSQVPPVVQLEASLNTTLAVALPVAFLIGLVLTSALVAARVILTESAPAGQQARVFAVQEVISESLVAAPLLLTGIGVTYAGARPVLAVIGVMGVLLMVVLELSRARTVRVPLPQVDLAPRAEPQPARVAE